MRAKVMSLFNKNNSEEQVMGSFILSEIRDLRKGMEGRDGELRGEIAAVRDAVATLSESVSRSQNNVEAIRTDVDTITKDFRRLRNDVDDMQRSQTISTVKAASAWEGPKKILAVLGLVSLGVAGVVTIITGWPVILAALVP